MFDHLLPDRAILLARQFCDCLDIANAAIVCSLADGTTGIADCESKLQVERSQPCQKNKMLPGNDPAFTA